MVSSMKNYLFPPSMDFMTNKKISPFVMYIFEFKHILTQQDLSDIWQNLPPELASTFEEDEVTVSHNLSPNEFFGNSVMPERKNSEEEISTADFIDKMRWMVFKVKKKAEKNYYNVTLNSQDDKNFGFNVGNRQDVVPDYSYNWPYDYFSMVELIKLDATMTWGKEGNAATGIAPKNPAIDAVSALDPSARPDINFPTDDGGRGAPRLEDAIVIAEAVQTDAERAVSSLAGTGERSAALTSFASSAPTVEEAASVTETTETSATTAVSSLSQIPKRNIFNK
jgi:hypothetical protein